MWELADLLLGKAALLPVLDPWPRLDIRNAELALAVAGQILARLTSVLAGKVDFEDTEDAQSLVAEAVDSVGDLFGGSAGEVVDLALVRGT